MFPKYAKRIEGDKVVGCLASKLVLFGDHVLISQAQAHKHNVSREAVVVGLNGFVQVKLSNNSTLDLDMRSLTFVKRS